jgi:hypothetical protein
MKFITIIPRAATAAALAATVALGANIQPARADGAASTRNILLGAAAIAGIAIEANVARKNAQAAQIQGYLPNGDIVYGDDRVVARDGDTYYPNGNGQQLACENGACTILANGGGWNDGNVAWNNGRDGRERRNH